MARKKDEAKQVLDRMSGATDTGLLQMCFSKWNETLAETRKAQEMEDAMNGAGGKFKSMKSRQALTL